MKNLKSYIYEQLINEDRTIKPGGVVFPKFGTAVFLAGGGGVGKSSTIKKNLLIDAKTIDVDAYKTVLAKHGVQIDGEPYDSHNPEHVSKMHEIVSQRQYKQKFTKAILDVDSHAADHLPNVIFDTNGNEPERKIATPAKECQEKGYRTVYVWVIASREQALIRNMSRDRRGSDELMHWIHNEIWDQEIPFIQSKVASDSLDEAYIVFTSGTDLTSFSFEDPKRCVRKLEKTDNGFKIDADTMKIVKKLLGKKETNPKNQEVYLTSDEIIAKFKPEQRPDGGYDFSKVKFKKTDNFYK